MSPLRDRLGPAPRPDCFGRFGAKGLDCGECYHMGSCAFSKGQQGKPLPPLPPCPCDDCEAGDPCHSCGAIEEYREELAKMGITTRKQLKDAKRERGLL